LSTTNAERELNESLAEVYSIIVTLDAVEKAYLKDSIPDKEYTETCNRLLKQYKSNLQDGAVSSAFGNLEAFMEEWDVSWCCVEDCTALLTTYQMECPRARERIRVGLPATIEQPSQKAQNQGSEQANTGLAVTAIENFITLLDAIKIGMVEKDMLHPLLVDIITSINKVTDIEFEDKSKIVQWLITLNQMKAAEKLNEEQARQFHFDMNQAYIGFKNTL
jgi:ESCRT-I complex subunit VPS28